MDGDGFGACTLDGDEFRACTQTFDGDDDNERRKSADDYLEYGGGTQDGEADIEAESVITDTMIAM